ncbi:autotransporter outer membrane beta-barrel domain-containing protein [Bartonella sp. B35(2025)]
MYKKDFLLYTIVGSLVFSHFSSAYADTALTEHSKVTITEENKILNNVNIRDRLYAVDVSGDQSVLTIKKGTITSEFVSFSARDGAHINAEEINAKAMITGLQIAKGVINLKDSVVTIKGNHEGYGIVFQTGKTETTGEAILTNTKLLVKDGVGILGPLVNGDVKLKNSEIRADVLLKNKKGRDLSPVTLTLSSDRSILEGRTRTFPSNTTVFTLSNDSKWFLKISENEPDNEENPFNYSLLDINQRAHSNISVLNLNNSAIVFNEPKEDYYQILRIGNQQQKDQEQKPREERETDATTVYNATGDAKIYLNLKWSDGAAKDQQKADRLLIHGNVSGTTTIYLNNLLKNENLEEAGNSVLFNTRGLSLVQVSGTANENSFKLVNGYTTMNGLPYKYTLNAYGSTSVHGKANVQQSFLDGDENFWDFRLQNAYLDPEAKIKALVPQVASYLVMPNALFSTGFTDVSNQTSLLNNRSTTAFGSKDKKKKGIFLSPYGNKITLSSNRSSLQYGYSADVHYAASQAGITLTALEGQNITTDFGLLGTYGKLAFTPKDMQDSEKSILDKWLLTAYGSIQHDSDLYVNTLFSYGILTGDITTAHIKSTTKLEKAETLSASATIGQKLVTNVEGLVFEPQAQLIYQHLMLGTLSDIDGFKVHMNNPYQWLVRVGGRLMQTFAHTERDHTVSFYGKLHVIKAFADNHTIKIGDTFHLDTMGSSVEGGLGVNAQLSQDISLHADISYQHKLQKSGVSGINFSGGMRYRF